MLAIINGRIVAPDALLEGYALVIEEDRIHSIIPQADIGDIETLDARGGYVTPGFVDIHSDYIETIISPRPTSMMDVDMGIREAERILIGHGITTMFHSLSIYKDDGFSHKPIRNPHNVQRMINAIQETHGTEHLIRNRMHARFEIDNTAQLDAFIHNIEQQKVHLISFMDHTPGQGQYRDLQQYRTILKGYREAMSEGEVDDYIATSQQKDKLSLQQIEEVSQLAIAKGIAVASHDDDTVEKLDLVQSFGTTISEFPITLEVARAAKERGLLTIAGAPNIMLGGSHSGNLCAKTAIEAGTIDILCSDYYPPAMLHSMFKLHDELGLPLHELFRLITLHPAQAVNMDEDIGSLEVGKKADVLIIEAFDDGYPTVTTTFVDGKMILRMNYR